MNTTSIIVRLILPHVEMDIASAVIDNADYSQACVVIGDIMAACHINEYMITPSGDYEHQVEAYGEPEQSPVPVTILATRLIQSIPCIPEIYDRLMKFVKERADFPIGLSEVEP